MHGPETCHALASGGSTTHGTSADDLSASRSSATLRPRVNTIAPGFFPSDITNSLYEDAKGDDWLRRNTPLPYHATVDDFVGAVLWLVSDAGRFVTGQTIVIDGGWTTA